MSAHQALVIIQNQGTGRKWQFYPLTSGDLGVFGEALGEAFGDFDVDLRSDGFEV